MIPVEQTKLGEHGNCYAACVASVLEERLEDLPDIDPNVEDWWELWNSWFAKRGLTSVTLIPGEDAPCIVGYTLGTVTSARGIKHGVVCKDGEIVWDPHPAQNSYDLKVESYDVLYPLDPSELVKRGKHGRVA